MTQYRRIFIPATLVTLATLFAGAFGAGAVSPRHAPSGPTRGGTIKIAYTTNIAFLDPAQAYTDDWWLLNGTIYNGLYLFDRNGRPQLNLAAAAPVITNGGTVWTFKIRPDARFSNGMYVSADDLKFAMLRTLNPKLKPSVSWGQGIDAPIFQGAEDYVNGKATDVSGIQVIDKHTIRFVLTHPFSPLPYILAITVNMAMPKAVMQNKSADWINTHPIGAGPFMLQSWQRGNQAVLVRNPYYFKKGQPYVDKIIAYENVSASLAALRVQKGELDGFGNDQEVAASDLHTMMGDPRYSKYIVTASPAAVTWLDLDVHVAPLNNPKVRQAIALAINRPRLVQLLGGNAIAAYQMYIPLDTQHDPALDAHPVYPYDPSRASALVKASGYKNQPITLLYGNDQSYFAGMAPGLQQMLQQVGLNVTLRGVSYTRLLSLATTLTGHQIDTELWSMDYPDGYDIYTGAMDCLANIAGALIGAHYCDAAADSTFSKAQLHALGGARDALLRQAQVSILQAAAEVPLVYLRSAEIVNPRVQGYYYQPAFGWQFENYWLKS